MSTIDLTNPKLYINRELSLLQFNYRVLMQALNEQVPLLERLRYLFICHRNVDEFFEIRVASLRQQLVCGSYNRSTDGQTPEETLQAISELAHLLVKEQHRIFNEVLTPLLRQEHIYFLHRTEWDDDLRQWLENYFHQEVLPILTPIGLDLAHPFPRLVNKSLNFILSLKGKDAFGRDSGLAIIHAPKPLARLIRLPEKFSQNKDVFVLLSSIIQAHADKLFPGMTVTGCYSFRLTRDSDLFVDEEQTDDLLHALKGKLFSRRYGDLVRLEVAEECPPRISDFLLQKFSINEEFLYRLSGPLNLSRLAVLFDLIDRPELLYQKYSPRQLQFNQKKYRIFDYLKKQDILLHHPYQSFHTVELFVHEAAIDPTVLAIKMTLYRTDTHSQLVDSLVEAARAGKEVTAVIELRARFDEADNIALANRLQEAGALVIYGVVGHKTHAKLTLIVRREDKVIRRYVHMSTGNYHSGNAAVYVDFGLMTCEEDITMDVHAVFQQLTGMGRASKLKKLQHAPFTLHDFLLNKIHNEIMLVESGKKGYIILKLNALTEPKIIQALYQASQAGVKIDLIVRGICCLRPQVKEVSENISVYSHIGRFLEHARIYYFHQDGKQALFLASADCMERNLFRRVEICFPVENKNLRERVLQEGLYLHLNDKSHNWQLQADGSYQLIETSEESKPSAQEQLLILFSQQ